MKKNLCLMLLALFASVLLTQNAFAEANKNAGTKFGRGFINAATFWMEIPKQTQKGFNEKKKLSGVFLYPAKGLGCGALRLASGLFDMVTFLVPKYSFVIFDPEYVFDGWD